MSATPPSIAIAAPVLGGPEVVRVVLNSSSSSSSGMNIVFIVMGERLRARGRGGHGGRGRGARGGLCIPNGTDLEPRIAALPAFFLRHWQPGSVSFKDAQSTYESLAPWGRTRFHISGGQLYYPDLKHNTFGCVLRRTPILAWALLEMLARHPKQPDVDIPVNVRPAAACGPPRCCSIP